MIVIVRQPDYLPVRIEYFDEKLTLARTIEIGELKDLDGRLLPTRWTVRSTDKPGQSTILTYLEIQFDRPMSDDLFSVAALSER